MSRDLVVAAWGTGVAAALLEDGVLLDWVEAPADGALQPGAVHLARVAQLRPDLGLVFVTLGGDIAAAMELGAVPPRQGDALVVQVSAVARDGKPVRVRARLSLVGRTVVLRKAQIAARAAAGPPSRPADPAFADALPAGLSMTLRSAAAAGDPARVRAEIAHLAALWTRIETEAAGARAPALLHAPAAACRAALPLLRAQPRRVLVAEKRVALALATLQVDAVLEPGAELFDMHDVATQLASADSSRIPLPGGGGLTIAPTPALIAVDVDAGGQGDPGMVNRRAAAELARQLRLRDLRGTIVVDFLRTGEASRRAVADVLAAAVAVDRRRVGLLGWTRGGLYEMRRGDDMDER